MAPIGPLAWERPYAVGVALERQKDKKTKNKKQRPQKLNIYCESKFLVLCRESLHIPSVCLSFPLCSP